MKGFEHIKLAGFIGFLLGIFLGFVNATSKIIALSFQWFEIYLAFLQPGIVFTLGFVIVGCFIEIIRKIFRLKYSKRSFVLFYTIFSINFALFFFGVVIINFYLYPFTFPWPGPVHYKAVFIWSVFIVVFFLFLITKGKELIYKIISLLNHEKAKSLFKNLIFIIVLFVCISFILDIYLINNISDTSTDRGLKDVPNIIFISMDTVRADHLSLYGYPLNTSPNIDGFVDESVVFNNAITTSSWTMPAHASMFTGKYPFHHNAIRNHQYIANDQLLLAEILNKEGYNTAGFVGGSYVKAKYGFGQGMLTYKDRMDFFEYVHTFNRFDVQTPIKFIFPLFHKIFRVSDQKTAEEVNKDVFRWLDKNNDQPFFLFIHYFDVHGPRTMGEEFRYMFFNDIELITMYDAEMYYLDQKMGELFERLEELDLKDNSIIIITSDHGEELYDHGSVGHGMTLYEEAIHVPLLIYYPEEFKAQRIEDRISLVNLFPTILDLINVEIPEDIDGVSMIPMMLNETEFETSHVFSELFGREHLKEIKRQKAFSVNNWKIIEVEENEKIPSSLFDLESDPKELENLYNDNEYIEEKALLQEYIINISFQ